MSIQGNLSGLPMQALQQAVLGQGEIPPYAALSELQRRVKQGQMQQAQQGQQAMAQQAQQQPPIAQQVMQQAQGIDSIPTQQSFANGGIVGYAKGDYVEGEQEASDREAIESGAGRLGAGAMGRIKELLAAGYDVGSLIPRGIAGALESGITRPLRAFGVNVPYLPDSFYGGDRSSMTPMMDKIRRAASPASPSSAAEKSAGHAEPNFRIGGDLEEQIRTLSDALRTPGIGPEEKAVITDQLVKLMAQNKGIVPTPAAPQRAAAPAGIVAALPSKATPAAAGPTAAPVPSTGMDSASEYLQNILGQNAKPDEQTEALRKEYLDSAAKIAADREARMAKREGENKGPAGFFSNAEMLGAAAEATRKGGIAGAAGAAAKVYGAQEQLRRSERDKIDTIRDANDQLKQGILEKKLAMRTGDVDKLQTANEKIAQAKMVLAKHQADMGDKAAERQKDLDVANINADAHIKSSRISADARVGGTTAEVKLMAMRDKAIDNVQNRLKNDPMLAMRITKDPTGAMYQKMVRDEMLAIGVEPSMIGGTSAQSGAGASLRYNPATGKIE